MTTLLIVLTNVTCPWPVFSWDGCGSFSTSLDPHPHTKKTPKNTRGVRKEKDSEKARGPTFQIKAAYNDSYLHTFRFCEHLHIQKKYSAIFPCLLSVRVCMARLRTCGSNVSGGTTTVHLCVILCVTCFNTHTHCEVGLVWPCVAT